MAIKVLKPELVSDPEAVARFMQERQILTSIKNPNVVRVIDLVAEGDTLAIVMELVHGQDLRRYLRAQVTLRPAEAVRLLIQLLHGVAGVHAAGVVHRDIKPENLLLDTSAGRTELKVTDFGVARLSYGASLTKLSSLIGTPEYMAPELAENNGATFAADLYSAGVVLYEMLGGRTPFAGGHPLAILRRHIDQAPPPIPGIPADLWDQITRLLAKDPAARPASAAEAADALASQLAALAPLPALPPMTTPEAYQPTESPAGTAAPDGHSTMQRQRDRGFPGTGIPAATGDPSSAGGSQPAPPPGQQASLTAAPGFLPSLPNGTVLRHRNRGESPEPGAPPPGSRSSNAGRWDWLRSHPAAATLAAGAVVVLAVAAVLIPSWLRHPAPRVSQQRTAVAYNFPAQRYPHGLQIKRHWTLTGTNGSVLIERLTASGGRKAQAAQFREPIPTSIASSLQTVQFTPPPTRIRLADHTVAWQLHVPAQGSVTVGYRVRVPADGATHARLARWAQELRALQAQLPVSRATKPAKQHQPSTAPTKQAPVTAPAIPQATVPATPQPPAQAQPGSQAYASASLTTSSPSITARLYFGQLDSVIAALSGQVTFNTSAGLQAADPGRCVGTVVFSQVSNPTGAVYAENPPASTPIGQSWTASAQLRAGNLTVQSGTYSLNLQARNGTAQTWLVDGGQTVTCNS